MFSIYEFVENCLVSKIFYHCASHENCVTLVSGTHTHLEHIRVGVFSFGGDFPGLTWLCNRGSYTLYMWVMGLQFAATF